MAEPLHRSRDDRMLAGVAAGVAETLDADPSIVRILWALLAILTGGIAVLVYVVMAVVVPEADDDLEAPPAMAAPPTAPAQLGASLSNEQPPMPVPTRTRAEDRAARRALRDARDSSAVALIIGVVLIAVGGLFLLRQALPWFSFHLWWPIAIVVLGVLLIVVSVRPNRPPP